MTQPADRRQIARIEVSPSGAVLVRPQVQFQKAYRKNPERMAFEINKITIIAGEYTDLKCVEDVFDIELGERIK